MSLLLTLIIILVLILFVAIVAYMLAWVLLIKASNRLTFRQLALKPGMSVVDVGCGSGRFTLPLAQQLGPTDEVLGIDIQENKLQRAIRRAQEAGLKNIRFERTGAGEGKLSPAHFDRATLVAVLGEIADREEALAEIFQALKPGGILSVTEGVLDPHYQNRERVRHLAQSVGFIEESCQGNQWLFTMNLCKPSIL